MQRIVAALSIAPPFCIFSFRFSIRTTDKSRMSAPPLSDPALLSDETDAGLIEAFARGRDEQAFAELVRRHAGWVEGVARRTLTDRGLAQEVVQNAFILLAWKAARVKPDALAPWLHRTTVLECRNARRRERTRQRALTAFAKHPDHMKTEGPIPNVDWSRVLPILDEAVNALPMRERTLVVQRFFQQRSWREIGASLGRSEDAARMALAPALEKLERLMRRRGVAVPTAALTAALTFPGKSTASAVAGPLVKNALEVSRWKAVGSWHPGAGTWLSTAACLAAGAVAGYRLTTRGDQRPAPAVVTAGMNSQSTQSTFSAGVLTPTHAGFDLAAVLNDLRSLQPSGNAMTKVVRLRAALMDMPLSAVPQVFTVLRTSHWGTDSAAVAAAFFWRWAALDLDAAWAAFREPDLLGAISRTLPAIFDGMKNDDPERFVRLLNTLPESQYYSGKAEACRAQFGNHSVVELIPHLTRIQAPALRSEMCRWLAARAGRSEDFALLANLAAGLPARDAVTTIPPLTDKWTLTDAGAVREWLATLPAQSPHYWAAITGHARAVSARDAIEAGHMIADIPWAYHFQESLKDITVRWMAADRRGALDWLTTAANIPASFREELVKRASHGEEAVK
jgi:RNA polymerase sigma factor (sigma-70 family)